MTPRTAALNDRATAGGLRKRGGVLVTAGGESHRRRRASRQGVWQQFLANSKSGLSRRLSFGECFFETQRSQREHTQSSQRTLCELCAHLCELCAHLCELCVSKKTSQGSSSLPGRFGTPTTSGCGNSARHRSHESAAADLAPARLRLMERFPMFERLPSLLRLAGTRRSRCPESLSHSRRAV